MINRDHKTGIITFGFTSPANPRAPPARPTIGGSRLTEQGKAALAELQRPKPPGHFLPKVDLVDFVAAQQSLAAVAKAAAEKKDAAEAAAALKSAQQKEIAAQLALARRFSGRRPIAFVDESARQPRPEKRKTLALAPAPAPAPDSMFEEVVVDTDSVLSDLPSTSWSLPGESMGLQPGMQTDPTGISVIVLGGYLGDVRAAEALAGLVSAATGGEEEEEEEESETSESDNPPKKRRNRGPDTERRIPEEGFVLWQQTHRKENKCACSAIMCMQEATKPKDGARVPRSTRITRPNRYDVKYEKYVDGVDGVDILSFCLPCLQRERFMWFPPAWNVKNKKVKYPAVYTGGLTVEARYAALEASLALPTVAPDAHQE